MATENIITEKTPSEASDKGVGCRDLLGGGPQWEQLLEVVKLLHHPNFYWGAMGGLTNCKYLDLRIDTRDLKCLVRDRDGKPVKLARIREGLEKPTMVEMNSNPPIEITVLSSPNHRISQTEK
jgi:hypothetical protein